MARHKKGQILLLTLIIIAIGAIILGGLFLYLNASQSASGRSEERALTYYAADSGFEDAIFWIQQGGDLTGWDSDDRTQGNHSYVLFNRDEDLRNDIEVDVSVVRKSVDGGNETYMIESTANLRGESIKIESYVLAASLNLSGFGADAITSNCSVNIKQDQDGGIIGDVRYNSACELTCQPNCEAINITGEFVPDPPLGKPDPPPPGIDWWPEAEDLLYVFGAMMKNAPHLTEDILYVEDNSNIGPLYREGDLQILSRVDGVDSFLGGIIYVTGNLLIGQTSQDFTLHLGNQTVFAKGDIQVGGKTTITGSGSIIALGDIYFAPKMQSEENDFVFIMSVQGELTLQPGGDFWGAVAANNHVQVQPRNLVGHRDPQDVGFEFPGSDPTISDVITYNIVKD